ncbi:hypothetical protein [Coraliomargarita sinensis]|uniref:hypothetical protein n=1 Tax=Coraliomargarita sinensis TaxID=2174842 RepID=UPI001E2CE126|nr:hypothetical protein [Coraliomargarita sinensis]
MTTNQWIPIILIILNIPIFLLIGRAMFGSWSFFLSCFKWHFIPDWLSFFTGKISDDWRGENKTGMYFLACLSIVLIELIIVTNFI